MAWSLLIAQSVPVGQYISVWKVLPVLVLLLIWARLLTWIDKDAPEVLLPRDLINAGMILGFVAAFALFLVLPGFVVAFAVLFLIMAIEIGVYLGLRNSKAGLGDLQSQFKNWIGSIGRGKDKEIVAPQGDVLLINKAGNPLQSPSAEDEQRPAYDIVQQILTEPLRRFAERVDVAQADGAWAVRYAVDGFPYASMTLDRAQSDAAIMYMKAISGMNMDERRKPQTGNMKVLVDGKKHDLEIQTAGSASGEQMRIFIDPRKQHDRKLEQLGFSDQQLEQIREVIADPSGVVLVAAPKSHGLTSTLYGILRAHDAFLTHIHTLEPDPDIDLEGITQNELSKVYNPAEDAKQIAWCISQEPEVIMISRVEDPRSAIELANFAAEKRVYVGLRAGSTMDALAMWRKLIGDDRKAMKNLKYVISGRVMRKLCAACKVAYTPDPTTLRKLGMNPEKVGKLYQARTTPLVDQKGNPIPCEFCRELQFKGRTGVYETLLVDDDIRRIVEAGGSSNQLKSAFRKQRGKYLQEQALAKVEAGETSVQEVLRVMKADAPAAAPASRPVAAPPKARR
ncbi:MAG TPA: ATPase, T2SS/T4P/T4SS family [Tepidisphaeraceae bacterium]|nr:ATPase, T2SS/T4P/T4SS family [Tepidisphaeraceae bacterium]